MKMHLNGRIRVYTVCGCMRDGCKFVLSKIREPNAHDDDDDDDSDVDAGEHTTHILRW